MTGSANAPLARYSDPGGRAHLVVLRGRLVLDVSLDGPPRVVAELSTEELSVAEGKEHALAVLHGDGGYLERAGTSEEPLCRPLRAADLRPPAEPEETSSVRGGEDPSTLAA
jgi:hypothetical protein